MMEYGLGADGGRAFPMAAIAPDVFLVEPTAPGIAYRHVFRFERARAGEPFDVMASASDAFTLEGYRRLAKIGVNHVLTLPWVFTHGDTKVLSEKKEGMRRFADDVIAKM